MARRSCRLKSGDRYSCEGRCPCDYKCPNIRRERKELDKSARRQEDRRVLDEEQDA